MTLESYKALFPDFASMKNFLIGIYDEGASSSINTIFQLFIHIHPNSYIEFKNNPVLSKIKKLLQNYYGQSAISIQFFYQYSKDDPSQPQDPSEFFVKVLDEIPDKQFIFQIQMARQYYNGINTLDDPDYLPFLELLVCSNTDEFLKTSIPKDFFTSFHQSLNNFFSKQNEEGYEGVYFKNKIVSMTDHILIKLKRFYKNYSFIQNVFEPLLIPKMIDFSNFMFEKDNDKIYKLKSIVFYFKSLYVKAHFAILIKMENIWVLFDNEKVSFPEYENDDIIKKLNFSIRTGGYLLMYKKTHCSDFDHDTFSLHHKEIPQLNGIEIASDNDDCILSETRQIKAVHHNGVFDNTFIVNSMFSNIYGILNVDPVCVPNEPYGTPESTKSLFGFFIRSCSLNLANKIFLKNDIGQDNLLLIQRKLFPGDINEDCEISISEFSDFLSDLYSQCALEGSVNNTKIANSIGSVRNLFTLSEFDDDIFNDDFFTFENYQWKDRAIVLDIYKTVNELSQTLEKNKKKAIKQQRQNWIKKKKKGKHNKKNLIKFIHHLFSN